MDKFALTLLILLAACQGPVPPQTPNTLPRSWDDSALSTLAMKSTEPQMQLGPGSLFTGADWNDPCVVPGPDGWVMYASSDVSFDGNVAIYRLVSTDAKTWSLDPSTAVLTASADAAAWDHGAVETPSVVWYRGLWHLFYTGYAATHAAATHFRIGHATSTDGVHWTKDAQPLLAPDAAVTARQFVVAEPAAVVFQDRIHLYFTQLGVSYNPAVYSTWQTLGLTRFDGTGWSTPATAVEPDLAVYPRWTDPAARTGDLWKGYSTPAAAVISGRLHLFFTVVNAATERQVRLHHAVSADGTAWTQDAAAFWTTQPGTWYSREVRSPAPFFSGGRLWLWWAGDDGAALGIGCGYWDLPPLP